MVGSRSLACTRLWVYRDIETLLPERSGNRSGGQRRDSRAQAAGEVPVRRVVLSQSALRQSARLPSKTRLSPAGLGSNN
jgi:hypothetical protein